MLVLDTSVLIDYLRGNQAVARFLERRSTEVFLVPSLVAWELWKGAESPREREAVGILLTSLTPDAFAPPMAQLAGEIHRQMRREGKTPPAFDLLIASHAIHHECPIATVDRDYSRIDGLQIETIPG